MKEEIREFTFKLKGIEKHLKKFQNSTNLFSLLKLQNYELKHSLMLAYLLDSKESHLLERQMLRTFLLLFEKKYHVQTKSFLTDYQVLLEYQNIDILLKSDIDKKIICFENKIWSTEHDNQLTTYHELLEKEYKNYDKLYFYLTPTNEQPLKEIDRNHWYSISYEMILQALQKLDYRKTPLKIKLLIEDYEETIRRDIIMENDDLKKYCMEVYLKNKKVLDTIMENVDVYYYSRNLILEYLKNEKEFYYMPKSSTHRYLNFKTKLLNEFFPNQDGVYYEVYLNKDFINVSLIFSYPDKMRKKLYEDAKEYVKMVYRTSFSNYKETSSYITKKIGGFDVSVLTMEEESDRDYIQLEMNKIKDKILNNEKRVHFK